MACCEALSSSSFLLLHLFCSLCQEWNDSVKLQQFFIEKRDELCGQGQILDSPAFSFGLPNLDAHIARMSTERFVASQLGVFVFFLQDKVEKEPNVF